MVCRAFSLCLTTPHDAVTLLEEVIEMVPIVMLAVCLGLVVAFILMLDGFGEW